MHCVALKFDQSIVAYHETAVSEVTSIALSELSFTIGNRVNLLCSGLGYDPELSMALLLLSLKAPLCVGVTAPSCGSVTSVPPYPPWTLCLLASLWFNIRCHCSPLGAGVSRHLRCTACSCAVQVDSFTALIHEASFTF